MGKAPTKTCPNCKGDVHVRKRECTWGYEFPKKEKKEKVESSPSREEQLEVELTFQGWKRVPPRSRNITCGLCREKMRGGDLGWHHAYSDGDKYWWCKRCETDDNYISPVVTVC